MKKETYEVAIIGSGPAGLTAAIYASRGKLKTLVIAGSTPGGQLTLTTDVEDFPGFPEPIQGPELMMRMRKQAQNLGAEFVDGDVTKVDFKTKLLTISTSTKTFAGRSVIIATGASAKWLGLPSEQKLIGRGVSACAVCDAAFFKDKKIAVVGGGDAAMREALFLTKFASEVNIIHRREELRAFPSLQERAKANTKIKFIWNSVISEVLGENKVEGAKISNVKTKKMSEVKLDGLFIAIGHKPNTEFLKGQVRLDKKGYVSIKNQSETSIPGVFAAGDVYDWHYQQAVTAAGAGCMAAMDAQEWLEEQEER
jgi:thioredoxin reductase (NADPH)